MMFSFRPVCGGLVWLIVGPGVEASVVGLVGYTCCLLVLSHYDATSWKFMMPFCRRVCGGLLWLIVCPVAAASVFALVYVLFPSPSLVSL